MGPGCGHYEYLQEKAERVLAANPQARARILGERPDFSAAKEHWIDVDLKAKTRTVRQGVHVPEIKPAEIRPPEVRPAEKAVFSPPEPPELRQSKGVGRRAYSLMATADRMIARDIARQLFAAVQRVTGYSIHTMRHTRGRRHYELSRARYLFFALLQVSYPKITLQELARPIGCDHTVARHGLQKFAEEIDCKPLSRWIEHPALAHVRPRLRAYAEHHATREGSAP